MRLKKAANWARIGAYSSLGCTGLFVQCLDSLPPAAPVLSPPSGRVNPISQVGGSVPSSSELKVVEHNSITHNTPLSEQSLATTETYSHYSSSLHDAFPPINLPAEDTALPTEKLPFPGYDAIFDRFMPKLPAFRQRFSDALTLDEYAFLSRKGFDEDRLRFLCSNDKMTFEQKVFAALLHTAMTSLKLPSPKNFNAVANGAFSKLNDSSHNPSQLTRGQFAHRIAFCYALPRALQKVDRNLPTLLGETSQEQYTASFRAFDDWIQKNSPISTRLTSFSTAVAKLCAHFTDHPPIDPKKMPQFQQKHPATFLVLLYRFLKKKPQGSETKGLVKVFHAKNERYDEKTNTQCCICLGTEQPQKQHDPHIDNWSLAPCGHYCCTGCVDNIYRTARTRWNYNGTDKCPHCRTKLRREEWVAIPPRS